MKKDHIKIIPLGGLGEIGKNMMVMEYSDDLIIIDAGLKFPDQTLPGVDLVLPNFSYVLQNKDRLRGIFITHGHEDHIGAVVYLLKEIRVPIYGTRLTLGLIKNKLIEFNLDMENFFFTIEPREVVSVGNFRVEFINVNHSIAGCVSLAIQTPLGNIIHTGDLKIDTNPIDNSNFDFYTFSKYGEQGVLLLLADSTNAGNDGYTGSESIVGKSMERIFRGIKGRIIVASFASNINRIQLIFNSSRKNGRKVLLSGLSMLKNVELARELGYLKFDDEALLSPEDIKFYPNNEITIITTGTQGEPMSALSRIANNTHSHIQLKKGDTVVISASVIPGNEKAVSDIINKLMILGADLECDQVNGGLEGRKVHVSGHAKKEELKIMLNLTKPKFFIPIHGEYRHLVAHARLAREMNIPEQNIIIAQNGNIIRLQTDSIRKKGNVPVWDIYVDGLSVGEVGTSVLNERKVLSMGGIVFITLALNQDWILIEEPRIIMKGFVYKKTAKDFAAALKEFIEKDIEKWRLGKKNKNLENKLKGSVSKFLFSKTGRKPVLELELFYFNM